MQIYQQIYGQSTLMGAEGPYASWNQPAASGGGGSGKYTVTDKSGVKWYVDEAGWSTKGYKASGGMLDKGWNVVGEEGPEVIDPTGRVHPTKETAGLLAMLGMNVRGLREGGNIETDLPTGATGGG